MIQRGVKTDSDRELLEYRPIIKYELQPGANVNNVIIPKVYAVSSEIKDIIDRLPSNTTRTIVSFSTKLNTLINNVEAMLVETPAFPNSVNASAVEEAAAALGLDVTGGITYKVYRGLVDDPYNDDYDKQIIMEAWRKYHADVNGSLAGEYYTELLELNQDINNLIGFWSTSALKYISPELEIDKSNPTAIYPLIEEKERVMLDRLILYKNESDNLVKAMRQYHQKTTDPNDPENIKYDKLSNKHKAINDQYNIMLSKGIVMSEVGDMITRKVNISDNATQRMGMLLKYTPQNAYEGKLDEVLETLLKGCLDGDFLGSLKRLRVIIKYQIDNNIRSINQEKERMESVFSNRIKQAVQDICLKDIAIKLGVCHPLLQELDRVPDNLAKSMKSVANRILGGLQEAEKQYDNDLVQLYGSHVNSARALLDRVDSVQDKSISRDLYRILSMMIYHVENGGNTPQSGSLKQWIASFLTDDWSKIYSHELDDKIQLDL